jgi:tryptophan synthase beta chain
MACATGLQLLRLDLEVYMVKVSYNQKLHRRILMEALTHIGSPQRPPNYGRNFATENPDNLGSLERILPSAGPLNGAKRSAWVWFDFVLLHQTVIGEESLKQMTWW